MSKTESFLTGLITGALAGSIIAVLYAPDTGTNTRKKLSYQMSHYRDELVDLIGELQKEKDKLMSQRIVEECGLSMVVNVIVAGVDQVGQKQDKVL